MTIDTLRAIPTPEGIELTLKVAGPIARARAWVIDLFIRLLFLFAFAIVAGVLGGVGKGLTMLFWFLLEWFYPVLFEVLSNGATPGKKSCGLRVLHEDGTPVSWRASFARNILRAADFLPFLYGFGLIAMLCNRDFKRLGDLAAGTIVVYDDSKRARRGIPDAVPRAPKLALTLIEQRAVIDFAERRLTWSDERANELAAHAAPVWGGVQPGAEVSDAAIRVSATRLIEVASFLMGRQPSAGEAVAQSEQGLDIRTDRRATPREGTA